jgi:hypothetical protein
MHRMRVLRAVIAVTGVAALLAVGVRPALGQQQPGGNGEVIPGTMPGGYPIGVELGSTTPGSDDPGHGNGSGGGGGGGGGNDNPCTYTRLPDYWQTAVQNATHDGMIHYLITCEGSNSYWFDALPAGAPQAPAAPRVVDPMTLVQQALRVLALPSPAIRVNPQPPKTQLVNLQTWLWIDRSAWGRRSETASVPGLSATVTAVPQKVTWSMGDGGTVTCDGPGTPYDQGRPPEVQRTDCSYVYTRAGEGLTVTAAIVWRASWRASNGASGNLPDQTLSASTTLRVAEAQAIN